ncbi:hypothetical protein [Paenibacillus sp. SN-8-1]|uniref:hypothetical protein n=1 Tax=Paenibacillus sp. SN-8-1 TaxID=3435409 RepID=UPI003D9A61F8
MKSRLIIVTGIILVVLTGCITHPESKLSSSLSDKSQQSQAKDQKDKLTPKVVQSDTTVTFSNEENKQRKVKLPEEISIDGWSVGVPFSKVVSKLPKDIKLDNSYMQYSFTSRYLDLSFTWKGVLDYILIREPGKGLNVNLNIGDNEQKIEEILGSPKKQSDTPNGDLAYVYYFNNYDIIIYAKDNYVRGIAMQLTSRTTINETEKICKYFNVNTAVKYASRTELITLKNDIFKRYKTLLEVISEDTSNNGRINAIFSDIDINQIELDLEEASLHWSSTDKALGRLVTEFVEAVLNVYEWQIIKNNTDDYQVKMNSAYQIRDASVRAYNANQKITVIINIKE